MVITFSLSVPLARGQRKPTPGRCIGCGCTDEFGCDEGCSWADGDHLLCSVCFASAAGVPVEGQRPGAIKLHVTRTSWRSIMARGRR